MKNLRRIAMCSVLLFLLCSVVGQATDKSPATLQKGANLFREKGCEYCHGEGGVGAKKGPPLLAEFRKSTSAEKIKNQLIMGGKKMPSFSDALTDEEIDQLIGWLLEKHRPAPNVPVPTNAQAN